MKKLYFTIILLITIITPSKAQTITIGTQVWTTRNLDVSTYRDGTVIPEVTNQTQWSSLTTGAWCYYSNTTSNGTTYGKLYNHYAVLGIWNEASKTDPSQRKQLAPTGFHIPTGPEFTLLINFLGGSSVAGGKMKTIGGLWVDPNTGATNSSGFTGEPGGYRAGLSGVFFSIGKEGLWWSRSIVGSSASSLLLSYFQSNAYVNSDGFSSGLSVRCLVGEVPLSNITFDEIGLNIYPNPSNGIYTFTTNEMNTAKSISIYTILGQKIYDAVISSNETNIDISNQPKGVYLYKVFGLEGETKSGKLVIE